MTYNRQKLIEKVKGMSSAVNTGDNLQMGTYTYGTPKVIFNDSKITIGKFCSISEEVGMLGGGEHHYWYPTTFPFKVLMNCPDKEIYTKGEIVIGNDVWLGHSAMILSGVTIGDGAVVGARAVVTKDVPPYAIVAGNPAKLIKYRFPPDAVEKLLKIKWWDKPPEEIVDFYELLMQDDIYKFIEYFDE